MNVRTMTSVGGVSFISGAVAFGSVFTYLAVNFDYPEILDGVAADVLPRLHDGGSMMRSVWAIYAFLPLFLIPGAVGSWHSCPCSRARMTLAMIFSSMAAFAMCLGLMRWPTIHWALADAYLLAGNETKLGLAATFDGLNLYLGNYIREFWLGLCWVAFSAIFFVARPIRRTRAARRPRAICRSDPFATAPTTHAGNATTGASRFAAEGAGLSRPSAKILKPEHHRADRLGLDAGPGGRDLRDSPAHIRPLIRTIRKIANVA